MRTVRYASFSEAGVRRDNEDYCQVVTDPENNRYLFVVCDGMGGEAEGGRASFIAVKAARLKAFFSSSFGHNIPGESKSSILSFTVVTLIASSISIGNGHLSKKEWNQYCRQHSNSHLMHLMPRQMFCER